MIHHENGSIIKLSFCDFRTAGLLFAYQFTDSVEWEEKIDIKHLGLVLFYSVHFEVSLNEVFFINMYYVSPKEYII